jgi:hypothetical protein
MAAVGASIGLLTSACETMPQTASPTGLIVGKVARGSGVTSVKAVSDTGQTYRAKVLDDGSYRFKPLPYGSYSLKFINDCGTLNVARVVLRESEHPVGEQAQTEGCVVVGMAEVQDRRA